METDALGAMLWTGFTGGTAAGSGGAGTVFTTAVGGEATVR